MSKQAVSEQAVNEQAAIDKQADVREGSAVSDANGPGDAAGLGGGAGAGGSAGPSGSGGSGDPSGMDGARGAARASGSPDAPGVRIAGERRASEDAADALPEELRVLATALDAAEQDARALVSGLSDANGGWRAEPGSWSVAECLDHLATANRVYLDAMTPAAAQALARGRLRRRPARPGLFGGWFVGVLEPPAKTISRTKAPRLIQPRPSPPLPDALSRFLASQDDVRLFLRTYAAIDLAGVRFPNPFIRGLRFSLATALHVIPAHERRHLWQAWRARRQAEAASGARHAD